MCNLRLGKTNFPLCRVTYITYRRFRHNRQLLLAYITKRHKEDFTLTHLEADYFYFLAPAFHSANKHDTYSPPLLYIYSFLHCFLLILERVAVLIVLNALMVRIPCNLPMEQQRQTQETYIAIRI